jgi:hypothetical protein
MTAPYASPGLCRKSGAASPNAAGLQIFGALRLLLAHADLRPRLEEWRCAQAALVLLPDYPRLRPSALPPVPVAPATASLRQRLTGSSVPPRCRRAGQAAA